MSLAWIRAKKLALYKTAALVSVLVPVIDLAFLFSLDSTTAEDPRKVYMRSLFIVTGGIILVFARKYFPVGSYENRSALLMGLGYVILGAQKLSALRPELILIRVIGDGVATLLFVMALAKVAKAGRPRTSSLS